MNFGFSEEQEMIRKSARDFTNGQSSMERIREMHDDERGYSTDLWKHMAEQGWLGAVFSEDVGGIDLGYVDLLCIQEELGKGLMPEPILSSVLLGGNTVFLAGSDEQKQEILPQVIEGSLTLTLGHNEPDARFDLSHVSTKADASNGSFVLSGFAPLMTARL